MRTTASFGVLLAVLLVVTVMVPAPVWAATGTVTRNCPTEPVQNTPISSGVTYTGSKCVINTTGDVDSFQFSATAGSTYRAVLGLGPAPTTNVCMTIYPPGSTTPLFPTACTSYGWSVYAISTNQKLATAGNYTIVVTDQSNATISYSLSLERLSPAPSDAAPLTLSKNIAGSVPAPTAQEAYTFTGNTAGTYNITGSLPASPTHDVCFDVYQPDGVAVVLGACTSYGWSVLSVTKAVTPAQAGTYVVIMYTNGNDATSDYNLEVSCLLGTCTSTKCLLQDSLAYSSGTLSMNFTIGTPYAATWSTWLVSGSTAQLLWSVTQPVTEPPIAAPKTQSVSASGVVGVLSTLSTAKNGITCSSWTLANTGKP